MVDDLSISGEVVLYRRIQSRYLQFDADGNPVVSDGAFRTKELSLFRSDRVTADEVLDGYPNDGLAEISAQAVRDAGIILSASEPPAGHVVGYRRDSPGDRIPANSSARMIRAAKLVRLPKTA
jgi:hypothetical protein